MTLLSQQALDNWFPTVVRYLGLALMLFLVVGSVIGRVDFPAGFVAATGMILYKSVVQAAAKQPDDNEDDRWSHLP